MRPTLDQLTRKWWRTVGREIEPDGEHAWLDAPMSRGPVVGDSWLSDAADRLRGAVHEDVPGAGLVAPFSLLDGRGFESAEVAPEVRDFYEHTSDWRMEVWTGWHPVFQWGVDLTTVRPSGPAARPADAAAGGCPRHGQPRLGDRRPHRGSACRRVDADSARQR